jgi:hypothetical protein
MKRAIPWILLLVAAPASGAELTRGITDVTPILNGRGSARVLFKAPPIDLGSVAIREAVLSFTPAGLPEERTISLRVHPVTTGWSPGGVDWERGWSRVGGDFDDLLYSRVELDLREGAQPVSIDLTAVFKEIVEEAMYADGFIVTVDPQDGAGFRVQDLPRMMALASARLDVKYRTVRPYSPESREQAHRRAGSTAGR